MGRGCWAAALAAQLKAIPSLQRHWPRPAERGRGQPSRRFSDEQIDLFSDEQTRAAVLNARNADPSTRGIRDQSAARWAAALAAQLKAIPSLQRHWPRPAERGRGQPSRRFSDEQIDRFSDEQIHLFSDEQIRAAVLNARNADPSTRGMRDPESAIRDPQSAARWAAAAGPRLDG